MSALANALRRLGALDLDQSAMKEVLTIIADVESAHAVEVAALKTELSSLAEQKKRKRRSDAERLKEKRGERDLFAQGVAPESRDSRATNSEESRDIEATVVPESRESRAAPSPAPLPSSSPPHPPNNYLPPTPIQIDDDGDAREKPIKSMISEEAHRIADEIGAAVGYARDAWPPGWCGAAYTIQKFINQGCPGEIIKLGVLGTLQRKRDGPPDRFSYFEKPIAAAYAEHLRPLPKVVVSEGHLVEVNHAQGSLRRRGAFDVARERWEKFKTEEERDS